MKIFLSAIRVSATYLDKDIPCFRQAIASHDHYLVSYYEFKGPNGVKHFQNLYKKLHAVNPNVQILLDSGAFSAWRLGTSIDPVGYYNFLDQTKDLLYAYVQLDYKANHLIDESTAKQKTKDNVVEMYDKGFKPVPVYHMTMKDEAYLEYLCQNFDYIMFGALAGASNKKESFAHLEKSLLITEQYGTRVHALGLTDFKLLQKYPFFSVDSSTWLSAVLYDTVIDSTFQTPWINIKVTLDYINTHFIPTGFIEKPWIRLASNINQMNAMEKFLSELNTFRKQKESQ